MTFFEDEIVLISSLNQYAFCPRRCALIYVEDVFAHNHHTLAGTFEHEETDKPGYEVRQGIKVLRALRLSSDRLGLSGKADWVEMHGEVPYPVEMKHGRKRAYDNDDIQLCAQALCLEEMMGTHCPMGAIYHIQSRHRREVKIDAVLRELTEKTILAVRKIVQDKVIPQAQYHPKCEGCSLNSTCMPQAGGKQKTQAQKILFEPMPWT